MAQKYQVIARKYRPQAFRDVVGQESAVTTLKNAIRFDKVAHAYLFCGSRGVGKTTLARLFAKALNCHALTSDLEPCNQCPSCLEIISGQSLDVIEIDGASNRGIDDIRQINETVGYAPSHGEYKIYIIDEVHMLTKEAFNALLKTLEEPPEQAKFFFATTEPHKVLPTIISRCQRFDLARIQPDLITAKLGQIAADLSRTVDPEALQLIARFAEGSLRDAESLFDQILCFAENTITASTVRQSLGLVPQELFLNLDQAFSEYRLAYAFELVDQLFQTGKDLAHFLEQLIEHYRNLTLSRTLGTPHPSARLYTQQQCLHILDLLINAETSFQKSPYPRIALESILLQIIRSKNRIPIEVLVRRLEERKTQNAECKTEEEIITPTPQEERKTQNAECKTEEKTVTPLELKPVPFNPFAAAPAPVPAVAVAAPALGKHPSHYDTLMRFAAIELEGTVKK
ncbi:MAG TPA: DNA polymerase III subunit gamma/tau [Chlamydiales bacterium]|nr:DNA polymerase III subunit gamma/tau [Chlamydiales bacterium]